jgi:hypothetical protein
MVSAERAAASRNKCLNLAKTCRSGSGPASERTSQSRQLMSAFRCQLNAFPDREANGMRKTVLIQANKNCTSKEIDEKRGRVYYRRRRK